MPHNTEIFVLNWCWRLATTGWFVTPNSTFTDKVTNIRKHMAQISDPKNYLKKVRGVYGIKSTLKAGKVK